MIRSTALILALGSLALVGCEVSSGTPDDADADTTAQTPIVADTASRDTAMPATRADLEQINRDFIGRYNQGDLEGFTAVYTEDAKLYPPNMATVEGLEAITEFWRGGREFMGIRDVSLTTEEMEIQGDRAWEVGRARYTTNQGPVEGRYMVVWKRLPSGEWRWHRDFMNSAAEEG